MCGQGFGLNVQKTVRCRIRTRDHLRGHLWFLKHSFLPVLSSGCQLRRSQKERGPAEGQRYLTGGRKTADRLQVFMWIPPSPTSLHLFNSGLCCRRHQDTGNKPPLAAHVDSCSPFILPTRGAQHRVQRARLSRTLNQRWHKTGVWRMLYTDLRPPRAS